MSPQEQLTAHLSATTHLSPDAIRNLADATATWCGGMTRGGGTVEFAKISVRAQQPNGVELVVKARSGTVLTAFFIALEGAGELTKVDVGVQDARTLRNRGAYLTPVGPKRMSGGQTYKKFLTNFAVAIVGHDTDAVVQLR